jgi:hypothetical protein
MAAQGVDVDALRVADHAVTLDHAGHKRMVLGRQELGCVIAHIAQALHHDPQAGRWLSQRMGLPLLALPATVTDDGPAATLEGLIDSTLSQLLAAVPAPATARRP